MRFTNAAREGRYKKCTPTTLHSACFNRVFIPPFRMSLKCFKNDPSPRPRFKCNRVIRKQRQLFCQLSKFAPCAIARVAVSNQKRAVASRYVIYHAWIFSLSRLCFLKIIFLSFFLSNRNSLIIVAGGTCSCKHRADVIHVARSVENFTRWK